MDQRPLETIPPLKASRTPNQCGSSRGWRKFPKPGSGSVPGRRGGQSIPRSRWPLRVSISLSGVPWYLLLTNAIQPCRGHAYHRSNRSAEQFVAYFSLAVALRYDKVPGQTHVVRSLISDNPTVVNSVDAVRWFTGSSVTPVHLLFHRMVGLPCIGPRSPVHLISPSTSSSRRRR